MPPPQVKDPREIPYEELLKKGAKPMELPFEELQKMVNPELRLPGSEDEGTRQRVHHQVNSDISDALGHVLPPAGAAIGAALMPPGALAALGGAALGGAGGELLASGVRARMPTVRSVGGAAVEQGLLQGAFAPFSPIMKAIPKSLYQSSLKVAANEPLEAAMQRDKLGDLGLNLANPEQNKWHNLYDKFVGSEPSGIPVKSEGLEQLNTLRGGQAKKLEGIINRADKKGKQVGLSGPLNNLSDLKDFYSKDITPGPFKESLDKVESQFLDSYAPGMNTEVAKTMNIPIKRAQEVKQRSYDIHEKSYGERGSAENEGRKALIRGLKEGIETAAPGVKKPNKYLGETKDLKDAIESSMSGPSSEQSGTAAINAAASLASAAKNPAYWTSKSLISRLVKDPGTRSELAIALNKWNKGTRAPKVLNGPNLTRALMGLFGGEFSNPLE